MVTQFTISSSWKYIFLYNGGKNNVQVNISMTKIVKHEDVRILSSR